MKLHAILLLLLAAVPTLRAQTLDDGCMLGRNTVFTGFLYSHDSWDHYWEGTLNRVNGNLGTVTTQTSNIYVDYGITDRLNLIVNLPHVQTDASQGVLAGQSGYQDISFGAKFRALDHPLTRFGRLSLIGVVSGSVPLNDYNPDFQPLSIGNHSKRVTARVTANFQTKRGWFLNGSSGYSWRSQVTLDRPYYYTDNQLYLTSIVDMPQVFDYTGSVGYFKHGIMSNFSFSQQRTQGGGDIRRQDAPFISNKINYSKIGALAMVPIPVKYLHKFSVQFSYARVIDGRNVGESNTYSTGLFYTLRLHGR